MFAIHYPNQSNLKSLGCYYFVQFVALIHWFCDALRREGWVVPEFAALNLQFPPMGWLNCGHWPYLLTAMEIYHLPNLWSYNMVLTTWNVLGRLNAQLFWFIRICYCWCVWSNDIHIESWKSSGCLSIIVLCNRDCIVFSHRCRGFC